MISLAQIGLLFVGLMVFNAVVAYFMYHTQEVVHYHPDSYSYMGCYASIIIGEIALVTILSLGIGSVHLFQWLA